MENKKIILSAVIIIVLLIVSVWAIYSNQKIDVSAKNSLSQKNISVYVKNESKFFLAAEILNKSDFVINEKEIVIKNLTISLQDLTTDEKDSKLKYLDNNLPSFSWLSDDEILQVLSLVGQQRQELQQKSDYHLAPSKIVVGTQSIRIINGSDYNSIMLIQEILANFPAKDIEGITEIEFGKTPVNQKTGLHYAMFYLNGKIIIEPQENSNWFSEFGDAFPEQLAHEVGHNIIDQKIAESADLERFSILHSDASSPENFLTKYAKEENFKEDFSESISFWRGNTRLFCKISGRNAIMREKFLITAKQFCRNNLCTAYIPLESKDESIGNFTAEKNIYRGLFLYYLKSQNIEIKNIGNFSEFAEKLNCK
jgi:hypothetical protein